MAAPYSPPTMYNPESPRIIDLILRRGDAQSAAALQKGNIWANAVQQIGGIAAGAVAEHQERGKIKKQEMAFQDFVNAGQWMQDPTEALRGAVNIFGAEKGVKAAEALLAFGSMSDQIDEKNLERESRKLGTSLDFVSGLSDEAIAGWYPAFRQKALPILMARGVPVEAIPEQYSPELKPQMKQLGNMLLGKETKAQGLMAVAQGTTVYDPNTQRPVFTNPKEEKAETLDQQLAVASVAGNQAEVDRILKLKAREAAATRASQSDNEPLVAIMGPDEQPVLVPRSQAVGKRPASIREQGRPVLSGDAGRIADFDTSLDDLNKLTGTLTESNATGTTAKIGAALPNWVTEWTGAGAGAKSKQAVIDRVKQVIGKALEGGVLRKEDEYKYEKILPIISDVPAVVQAKLDGLWDAITRRRQTLIESLSDANFDVEKYKARAPRERIKAGSALSTSDEALLKKYGY